MAWNEPGNNNQQQDPWRDKRQGPPDLDQLIRQWLKKLAQWLKLERSTQPLGWGSLQQHPRWGTLGSIILALLLVFWFIGGIFIVDPSEEAVVLRFGKYIDTLGPGLHWLPMFIDSRTLVDVEKIHSFTLEGNFLTKSSEQLTSTAVAVQEGNANVTDKDKNLVFIEMNIQYHIDDPRAYLFQIVDPDDTINQAATSALSDVVGQMKLDEVLTDGRGLLNSGVLTRLKQLLNRYQPGLTVVTVTIRRVQPPDQIRVAFNDVIKAGQQQQTYIQRARAYASKVIPIAQGDAARIVANANAYRAQVTLGAKAHIAQYEALLKAYLVAPEITSERLYLDTMQRVLGHTSKILVDNTGNPIFISLSSPGYGAQQDSATFSANPRAAVTLPTLSSVSEREIFQTREEQR